MKTFASCRAGDALMEIEDYDLSIDRDLDLPKLVLFGDEVIELDKSMFSDLCPECEKLGYCKKRKDG